MKKISILLLSIFLFNCATTKNNLANYDNTNPIKIEESTQGLEVSKILPPAENIAGTIAIKSIELDNSNHLDVGVTYMIEDNLISNLIKNNYRVVERDPDILKTLHLESDQNYRKYKESDSKDTIEGDGNSIGETVININNASSGDNNSNNDTKNDEGEYSETNLKASDYILSYRVLECGIVYNELADAINLNSSSMLKIERSARTRLHVRLTDSKTSEIISADILENEVTDIINKTDLISLQQMPYEYYHHTLPNQGLMLAAAGLSEDSGYKFNTEKTKIEKGVKIGKSPAPYAKPILLGAGIVLFLMIINSDGDGDDDDDMYYNNDY